MVGRAERAPLRTGASRQQAVARQAQQTRLLGGGQRLLFTLALVAFALATMYSAIALLTRVTPALFPGRSLDIPFVQKALAELPGPAKVETPGADSVFNRRINLLVMGLDKRPNEPDGPYRTDTIMVATIDPVTKVISLVSFPRDLFVDINIPGQQPYKARINVSYAEGFRRGGDSVDAGARQLMRDIKANFGIDLDHWVLIDFQGVEKIIDSLGGIELDIPEEIAWPWDWWYSDEGDRPARWLNFPAGKNRYTGYEAVAFGRNRNDDDLNRVKRQQLVVMTAMRTALAQGIFSKNPVDLWDTYASLARHDIPITKWPGYLSLLRDSAGRIQTYSVADPVDGVPTVEGIMTDDGAAVLLWNRDHVNYWISQAFTKHQYAGASVEIQNGYGPGGGARSAALGRYLKYVRYLPVVDIGIDVPEQPTTTIVLYSPDRRALAADIASWLGLSSSAIRVEKRPGPTAPDVLVIIGRDFELPSP